MRKVRKKLGPLQEKYKLFSPVREKKQQIWLATGVSTKCEKILDKL